MRRFTAGHGLASGGLAAFLGDWLATKVPLKWIRWVAASFFFAFGAVTLWAALGTVQLPRCGPSTRGAVGAIHFDGNVGEIGTGRAGRASTPAPGVGRNGNLAAAEQTH